VTWKRYQEQKAGDIHIVRFAKESEMPELKKRPDLTSMELQKYVGDNYKQVKASLESTGLTVFCAEESRNPITKNVARNVDIRYDTANNEIIRIWRTE
jgi:predicted xylose isomerase-like sugar epimerase